jgi:hypothetical protein
MKNIFSSSVQWRSQPDDSVPLCKYCHVYKLSTQSISKEMNNDELKFAYSRTKSLGWPIEIIDIECVLLSFLSEKFVSTKWRIYKGILVGPRLLRRGISRGCRECELFFQLQSLQKILYRDLKWKKSEKSV